MKKFEITKEQLKGLIEASVCNIKDYVMNNDGFIDDWMKEAFPEAFKKELEIGKYYKNITHKGSWFFYDGKVSEEKTSYTSYGCDSGGNWHAKDVFGNWNTSNEYEEMTQQEVETDLINEAKKRGLWHNKNIICLCTGYKSEISSLKIYFDDNKLWSEFGLIFDKGKWATIIETISKEDAEKLLNKKIV